MDIEILDYFRKIAEIKSISKVADMSHISQPALSQQMQKLEETLGRKLFIRSNKGVELTEAGELVLKYSDNIVKIYDNMLNRLEKQQKNEIKIEADFTIATYCLPCALLKMKDIFPTHNYILISGSADEIEENVMNDICEVGFITRTPRQGELDSEHVIEEKVVLISPKSYGLPEKIGLKEILEHPLIILKDSCIIKENLARALNDIGHSIDELNIIARLETTEAIKTLVQKGFGLGFTPYNAVKEEHLAKKLQVSRIDDYNLDYNIFMVNKTSQRLTDETREFIKGFKDLGESVCC